MEVGGEDIGRIEFELRADVVPETAENFRQLVRQTSRVTATRNGLKCPVRVFVS